MYNKYIAKINNEINTLWEKIVYNNLTYFFKVESIPIVLII